MICQASGPHFLSSQNSKTSTIGYGTALRIQHTGHLPTYIYRCNIGADEADFDVVIRLAVSEKCRKHRSMKLFNLGSTGRTHAAHICEVSVLGEHRCERMNGAVAAKDLTPNVTILLTMKNG
jgi:hypothetical protein